MNPLIKLSVSVLFFLSLHTNASAFDQKKGFIQNDKGNQCWYTQVVEPESTYFYGTLKGRLGIIKFDNPACMKDSGLSLDINKMLINNIITRWYSHPDAAFKTRVPDLYPTSPLQKRGMCIQSTKYPVIGVTVDYVVQNNSIVAVYHGSSLQGCTR